MVFWILFLFGINFTDGCLKVIDIYTIPEGCNCSLPIAIDANGILEMSESSQFLKDRFTVKPSGFYVEKNEDGCFINANAAAMPSSYDTFNLMIFSKNGKPVMERRYTKADQDARSREFQTGLRCLNFLGNWVYHGSHKLYDEYANYTFTLEGVALALQADEDSCKCRPPVASAVLGILPTITAESCDVFRVTCGNNNPGLYFLSSSANNLRIDNINEIPDLLTCVKSGSDYVWYYNDIRMEDLEFTCKDDDGVEMNCGCRELPLLRDMSGYDLTGEFSYYGVGGVISTRYFVMAQKGDQRTCRKDFTCQDTVIIFENNNTVSANYYGDYFFTLTSFCLSTYKNGTFENGSAYYNNAPVTSFAYGCVNMSVLKPLVMPRGFSCRLPKAIVKEEIKKMPGSFDYEDRETYDPVFKLFEITNVLNGKDYGNSTVIEAACTGRSDDTIGYLIIFRTNGPPITAARFYGKGFKKFVLQGLLCPKDGTSNWLYYGGVLENPTFACQEDTSCDCPAIRYTDRLGQKPEGMVSEKCFPSKVTCSSGSLYITGEDMELIKKSLSLFPALSEDLDGLICRGGGWFYHDDYIRNIELTCDTSDTSGITECPSYLFLDNAEDVAKYDQTEFFANKGQVYEIETETLGTVYANPKVSLTQFKCESGIAVFPQRGIVWSNESGVLNLFCGSSAGLFIDGTSAANVAIACYDENTDRIPMGKCKCPHIWYIDQDRVRNTENSAHLGERETVRPKVKFGEECQMDISWDTPPAEDFYFMVFRENGPPIFNKRFVNSGDGSNHFSADGVQCVQIDGEYEWQYYGGKLTNISFAFQSNKDKCECKAWQADDSVKSIGAVDGKCDNFRVTCGSFAHIAYISGGQINGQIILPRRTDNQIEELTCASVDGEHFWYYSGIKTSQVTASCGSPTFGGESFNAGWSCSCPNFFVILPDNDYIDIYNKDQSLGYVEVMEASIEYELSLTCKPTFTCEEPAELVFFSANNHPLFYPNDVRPAVECHMTQLGGDPSVSSSYWYVDGILLAEPAYGCVFRIQDYVPP